MSRTRNTNRPGFTLLELLVVMAILIALMALIIPAMMTRQRDANIRQTKIQLNNFDNTLVLYQNDNRGFPTTEQGLMALIYIPDNAGMGRSTLMSQQGVQPGVPGDMGTGAFGSGEANVVGDTVNPMAPMPGAQPDPMAMQGGNPMADPLAMQGGAPGFDPMNPNAATGGAMGGWTEPVYNPAIYTQVRKRPQPYVEKESDLIDPWGTPYRYENNLQFNGLNRTGTAKPAIWSAGPDKLDHTDDDVQNWDPVEAQQLIAARQQQLQGGGVGGTMGDPMNPMQSNPMDPMNPMNPMQPGPMDGGMNPMPPGPTPMPQPMPQPGPTPMPMPQPTPTPMPTPQPGPTP